MQSQQLHYPKINTPSPGKIKNPLTGRFHNTSARHGRRRSTPGNAACRPYALLPPRDRADSLRNLSKTPHPVMMRRMLLCPATISNLFFSIAFSLQYAIIQVFFFKSRPMSWRKGSPTGGEDPATFQLQKCLNPALPM